MFIFRFLWKLIKWSLIIIFAIIIGFVVWAVVDPEGSGWNASSKANDITRCINDHGETNCDAEGNITAEYQQQLDKKIEQARIAEEERIAEEKRIKFEIAKAKAKRDQEKAKKDQLKDSARLACLNYIRKSATYPSKVKFKYFSMEERMWENFNKQGKFPNRYSINVNVEMMNGFGVMLPNRAHCKIDFNNTTSKLVDLRVTNR